MSLSSVMQTALSGFNAATTTTGVVANNLANARTNGFKASKVNFSTQTPSTISSGGGNASQIGTGVTNAGTNVDFSQGSLTIKGNGSTLALQGRGLFILEGPGKEKVYSRNGQFQLNANSELIDANGFRLQGFQADAHFNLNRNKLSSLRIPLGQQFSSPNGQPINLTGFQIENNGIILGKFSDGSSQQLGQLQVAQFNNPSGLTQRGGNTFAESSSSGIAIVTDPGTSGSAEILPGAVELSNVDIGQNLIDLIEAETLARSTLNVIETSQNMFDSLLNLSRLR